MQAIMEPIFEVPYLICVVVLGILTIRKTKGRRKFFLFGIMAIILGCGDAFHLIPRMWYLITAGTATMPEQAAALGFGKMVTSITMTVFYVMLYHVWQNRYNSTKKAGLTGCIYFLAIARIILCLLPQNQWLSPDAPLSWGVYRNIPFVIIGIIIKIYNTKGSSENYLKNEAVRTFAAQMCRHRIGVSPGKELHYESRN